MNVSMLNPFGRLNPTIPFFSVQACDRNKPKKLQPLLNTKSKKTIVNNKY